MNSMLPYYLTICGDTHCCKPSFESRVSFQSINQKKSHKVHFESSNQHQNSNYENQLKNSYWEYAHKHQNMAINNINVIPDSLLIFRLFSSFSNFGFDKMRETTPQKSNIFKSHQQTKAKFKSMAADRQGFCSFHSIMTGRFVISLAGNSIKLQCECECQQSNGLRNMSQYSNVTISCADLCYGSSAKKKCKQHWAYMYSLTGPQSFASLILTATKQKNNEENRSFDGWLKISTLNENPIEMHSLALNWNEVLTTLQ